MFKSKKILKIIKRTVLLLFGLILLLFILINLPPVQKFLSRQVAGYMSKKLNTEVTVNGVYWKLPKYISVNNIYVADQQKDTLIWANEIRADVQLSKIFRKELGIKSVLLKGAKVDIHPQDQGSNLDFIIDAFAGDTTKVEAPKDTSNSAWAITFPETTVLLEDIDAYYADTAQAYDIKLGHLSALADSIDLNQQVYQLNNLALTNTDITIDLKLQDTTTSKTVSQDPLSLFLGAKDIKLEDIRFQLDMSELSIDTYVGKLQAINTDFELSESMDIAVEDFLLENGNFKYDVPGTPVLETFDPNHIHLLDLTFDVSNTTYHDLDIYATINQLAAQEPKGIQLDQLNAEVHYNLDTAEVKNLEMATSRSSIQSSYTLVTFPFITSDAPLGAMKIRSDVEKGIFHPEDALFFAPMLEDYSFMSLNKDKTVAVRANVDGRLNKLKIKQLDFNGWDTHLNCSGVLNNPLDINEAFFDIDAKVIEVSQKGIQTWIPPNSLPDFIELPSSTLASATVTGFLNDLIIDINARTTSPIEPISSSLIAQARLKDVLDTDNLQFVVDIDSLYTSKSGLLSFIPATSLPDYIDLPPEVKLDGRLEGSLDTIFTDFKLYALRGGNFSYLNAVGNVSDFFGGQDPLFDISIRELDLKEEEILAFLPKGILPPYIKLPNVRDAKGFLKGYQDDLNSTLEIITDVGTVKAKGFLKDSTYEMTVDLSSFDLRKLFKPGSYEEVVGLPISTLGATLFISGSGFDPDSNLLANYKFTLKPLNEDYNWKEGLVAEGIVDRQSGTMNVRIDEDGIAGTAASVANFNLPNESFDFEMDLEEFDFRKLKLIRLPFKVGGKLEVESTGSSIDQLTGAIKLDDWVVQYDSLKQTIDSLVVTADLDTNLNKIAVKSDFIYGNLDGKFKFDEIAGQIQRQASSYFDPTIQLSDTLPGTKDAYMNMYFEIDDPSILTMGYIPGLESIEPCFVLGSFSAKDKSLKLYSELPYLKYADFELIKLFFFFTSDKDNLDYEVNFTDIFLYDQYQIHNVNLTGEAKSGFLSTQLNQRDTSFVERFNIHADIVKENDQFEIALDPKLLLNYQDWQIKPSNRVIYGTENVNVIDWRLSYDNQYIELLNNELNTENLTFKFGEFDLNFIADLIKLNSKIIGGILSGTLELKDIYESPLINTDLTIADLNILQSPLGDLNAAVQYDANQLADINASMNGYGNDFTLTGQYQPDSLKDDLNLNLGIRSIELSNLSSALKEYVSLLDGQIHGDLSIKGETDAPQIRGTLGLEDASVRPNILQARFDLDSALVSFKEDGINIPACILKDSLGQEATFSANILTYNYQDFGLLMNFDAEDFLLLNTKREDNDLYFGKMIADVSAEIIGDFENPIISVDAKAEKGSDITYIYSYGGLQSLETGDGIVEFISLDTVGLNQDDLFEEIKSGYGLDISVNASIDENLTIKVITDEITGDNFTGQGEGEIALRFFPNNDIELTGRIALLNGSYDFTYSEVIKRTFEVVPESYVNFLGDPYNPELRLTATYTTRTAPYPLIISTLGGEGSVSEADRVSWEENYQKPETFITQINVDGQLKEIELSTGIEYPSVSGNSNSREVKAALARVSEDESKTNTQAFSLILFNGFIAEDIGSGDGTVVNVQSGLSDLISNQLNNLANQYIKFVDIDFGLESTNSSSGNLFEDTDFRISLKKSFFDDRLSVNVDGVATSDSEKEEASSYYLNNISIEYSLTRKGLLKVRVFNKRETDDVFNGDVVKLGGALLFSKDFDQIRLFKPKNKK